MYTLNFELFKENDPHLLELKKLYEFPEIKKWVHISDNYFNYIIQTENAYLVKILLDHILVGEVHFEIIDSVLYFEIIVHPDYQRQGIGKLAVEYVIQNYQCEKYVAEIEEMNVKSIKLFESLGFKMESQEDEIISYVKTNS